MNTLLIAAIVGGTAYLLLTRREESQSVSPNQVVPPTSTGQAGTDPTKPISRPMPWPWPDRHDPIYDDPIVSPRMLGDVDGDGVITENDALLVRQIVAGGYGPWTQDQLWAADVNQDGQISSVDALFIKRHILGLHVIPAIYYELGMPIPQVL